MLCELCFEGKYTYDKNGLKMCEVCYKQTLLEESEVERGL